MCFLTMLTRMTQRTKTSNVRVGSANVSFIVVAGEEEEAYQCEKVVAAAFHVDVTSVEQQVVAGAVAAVRVDFSEGLVAVQQIVQYSQKGEAD